ncbi:hypothetical protein QJ854_gp430 [Moumouvirus goulette]|uniref:Uncharacterized protein n=1 Tax=Moumouvirus goulette TaxID=1247379 RepID=M1PX71_9VIRU|nr:hypothetical protein QJ854_gp430 [Moumouvirus goulette]AGF85352.1 hypothetical protein glt_00543 [Moumouvirus goulette]
MSNNNPHYSPEFYKTKMSDTNFVGTNIFMNTIFNYKKSPAVEQMLQDQRVRQKQICQDFDKYINKN